jgi:hypothetical protein
MQLSKRVFYPRVHRLKELGLVKRVKGRYFITEFGKVVYRFELMLDNACHDYWKLKALDFIPDDGIPNEERDQIIENMIQNKRIKDIIRHQDVSEL